MKEKLRSGVMLCLTIVVIMMASKRMPADTGTCGGVMTTVPFTDVMGNIFFCQIAEAYLSGLTKGTTSTTYSPSDVVLRDQMAAFATRTQDSALRRGSRRAALEQWATLAVPRATAKTTVGSVPQFVKSDGADLWVADLSSSDVKRVRASDGRLLETWTGATFAYGVLVTQGRVYVTGDTSPGSPYVIDPTLAPGDVATLSSSLGNNSVGLATDGIYIWTTNFLGNSISKVDPVSGATTNIGGFSVPNGILFDGANLWITEDGTNTLKKLDSSGGVLQTVDVGANPQYPVFDGSNIWVPNFNSKSVTVVRVRDGQVLATLTGNGLSSPSQAAFDGEHILVTNVGGRSVSLWKATDLTAIGTFSTGATSPFGACSDGINFWITLESSNQLARF